MSGDARAEREIGGRNRSDTEKNPKCGRSKIRQHVLRDEVAFGEVRVAGEDERVDPE